jgi:peptide/nickel transport system permease protein
LGALIGRRLLSLIPLLLIVSFVVFSLVHLIPGDAATVLAGGDNATPERIAEVRHELRLDEPFLTQYKDWLVDAVQGDFGTSFNTRRPVSEDLARTLPITASVVLAAAFLGLLIGVPVGLIAGMRAGSRLDRSLIAGTTAGIAIPNFWLATMLIVIFAINWHVFPALGFVKFSDSPTEWARHVALPAFALSLGLAAAIARQLRAAMADAMESKYIRAMWAKGATKRAVAKHAMKNAAIPAVTVFGFYLGALLGGAVIVEQIFSIPGLGSYVLQGVLARDVPVIQGVAIMFVLIYVAISLILDITYGYLNPRVRVS